MLVTSKIAMRIQWRSLELGRSGRDRFRVRLLSFSSSPALFVVQAGPFPLQEAPSGGAGGAGGVDPAVRRVCEAMCKQLLESILQVRTPRKGPGAGSRAAEHAGMPQQGSPTCSL